MNGSLKLIITALFATTAGYAVREITAPKHGAQPPAERAVTATPSLRLASPATSQDHADLVAIEQTLAEKSPRKRSRRLAVLLDGIAPERIPSVIALLHAQGDDEATFQSTLTLLEEWATHDPKAAAAWATASFAKPREKRLAYCRIATAWARVDPETGYAWLEKLEKDLRGMPEAAFAEVLALSNPQKAITLFNKIKDPENSVSKMFATVARKNPKEAIELALMLSQERQRQTAFASIAEEWGHHDPKAAYSWLAQLPPGKLQDETFRRWFESAAKVDPAWSIEVASTHPGITGNQLATAAGEWSKKEPMPAIRWAMQLDEDKRKLALAEIARNADLLQANAILLRALQPEEGSALDINALAPLLHRWLTSAPDAALSWVDEHAAALSPAFILEAGDSRDFIFFPQSPAHTIKIMEHLAGYDSKDVTRFGMKLAIIPEQNLEQVMAGIPPGRLRDRITQGLTEEFARVDLDAARASAETIGDAALRDDAYRSIGERWAKNDPEAAADWAMEQSTAPERVMPTIIEQWAQMDPHSAREWIETLPAGTLRDTSVSSFATTLTRHTPQQAAELIVDIRDPKLQRATLVSVFTEWKKLDEPKAKAWLQASKLPPAWKTNPLAR